MTPDEEFSAVYARHCRDVERYLYRRAPDVAVADLTAEVFLVAWRRWDRVPRDRPLPWLYATAAHVLANEVRGRRRYRRLTEWVAQHNGPAVAADHAEEVSERAATAAAFDQLGEPDREVLRLVAWERLSLSDAAKVLGCSTPAFTMRLARARRRLRAALAGPEPERAHPEPERARPEPERNVDMMRNGATTP